MICPECSSTQIKKNGRYPARENKKPVMLQKWQCLNCHHHFVEGKI